MKAKTRSLVLTRAALAPLFNAFLQSKEVCSTDIASLREWAAERGYEVSDSQDCRP